MTIPTRYLDLLLLSASVYPAGFSASLDWVFSGRRRVRADERSLALLGATLGLLIALAAALKPSLVVLKPAGFAALLGSGVAGPCLLGVEYVAGMAVLYASSRQWGRGVSLHAAWGTAISAPKVAGITLIAIGEEILYRQMWISLLAGLGAPWSLAWVLSSVVYGWNHLAFGLTAVFQKTVVGAAYGGLYLASGGSVYAPVAAHVAQNLTLVVLTRRLRG